MKVVVDTKIVFSALLNTQGNFGKLLINYGSHFHFYSYDYLKVELLQHRTKLIKLTGITANEMEELQQLVTGDIQFINQTIILDTSWKFAQPLLKNVDPKDTAFVALSHYLKAKLWTGDKPLIKALAHQSSIKTIDSNFLLDSLRKTK